MKKLNKRLALAVLSLGFAALTPSAASASFGIRDGVDPSCVEPCRTDSYANECFNFDLGVEFLYWKPCVDDLDFSATKLGASDTAGTPSTIRYNSVCPQWEPGFRVTLTKEDAWKCFDLAFTYTWLKSDDSSSALARDGKSILAVGLHPNSVNDLGVGAFESARGKWHFRYQTFDLLLSYPFRCGSCHTIAPFFGVEIVKFDQKWDTKYAYKTTGSTPETKVAFTNWDADLTAAGLKLGTDYSYLICEGFSVFAKASGTIVVGDFKATNKQSLFSVNANGSLSSGERFNFGDDGCCRFVPGSHVQVGVQFEDEACGCAYKLRLGYEMVHWFNMQNPRRWFGSQSVDGNFAQSTQSNTSTVGFHGLLAGVEVKF